jgi:hypothetical protein
MNHVDQHVVQFGNSAKIQHITPNINLHTENAVKEW